jgi:hypothetical protein
MSVAVSNVWSPPTFGRTKLDGSRWAWLIEAPFDMDPVATGLLGSTISLGGQDCEIRGLVPRMPVGPISKGQLIEVLVACKGR